MSVSAPGKIMLLGDYAVLEGAPAVVAAVNRRAVGRIASASGRSSSVVAAVLARAGRPDLLVEIDTASFYDGEDKLGLGSSAAVAVVTAALATGAGDERTLRIAIDGHRDANDGRGSGVDVAASFCGGVIVAKRQPGEVVPLSSQVRGLSFSVLFTNKSASTKELVAACQASAEWARWSSVLAELTREGIDAWQRQDPARFLSVVARYHRAMAGLGESAGVAIVTEEIDAIARYAQEEGGAAKPSGAGGGDVAVLWGADPELGDRVASKTGTRRLALDVDRRGLVRDG